MDNKITPIDVESAVVKQETYLDKKDKRYNKIKEYHYTNIIYKFDKYNKDGYIIFCSVVDFYQNTICHNNNICFHKEINVIAYILFNMITMFLLDTFYINVYN